MGSRSTHSSTVEAPIPYSIYMQAAGLEYRPDRWSASGWRWLPVHQPSSYFQRSVLSTARPPGLSVSVDARHSVMMPDRWSPTGWKLVAEGGKSPYLQHANKRNIRRTVRIETPIKGEYQTTSRTDYSPPYTLSTRGVPLPESYSPAASPPLRRHKKLRSVQESLPSPWPADPNSLHHKTKHQESAWARMHLSGGTIR